MPNLPLQRLLLQELKQVGPRLDPAKKEELQKHEAKEAIEKAINKIKDKNAGSKTGIAGEIGLDADEVGQGD